MERVDYEVLERHHEKLERMVRNQAISNFDLDMKKEIVDVLTKYGRMTGLCSICNSHLLSIAAAAVRLYNENKNDFKDERENNGQKEAKGQNKKVHKRQSKRSAD